MVYLTSEVFYAYMYWFEEEEEEEKSSMVPLTCLSTFVSMYNVEWLPQKNYDPPPIDECHKLGIQSICQEINITMISSNMADNPVYFFTVTNLNMYIYGTIFEGSEQGSVTQGGLKINTFCFPRVIVENCTFNHLVYNDIAFAQVAALKQNPAAIYVNIEQLIYPQFSSNINRNPHASGHYHIHILKTTYSNNFHAAAVSAFYSHRFWLQIKDVIFTNNQAINDGGALYIHKGKDISIQVENCEFLSNMVGVIPFGVGLMFPGYTIGFLLPIAYGYEIILDNMLGLDAEFKISNEQINKTIQLNL